MRIAVLFIEGFEEIEANSIVDILRRAELSAEIIGVGSKEIKGAHGIIIHAEKTLDQITSDEYDAVVLPGGAPGYMNLSKNERVTRFIKEMDFQKKWVAAICASPFVLAKAGILDGKKATIYPGMEDEITTKGGLFQDDIVVVDDHIITSRGPATSIPFALTLVSRFKDDRTNDQIRKQLLADMVLK